jgi:16S rRNA (guanine527-N7)-methyltransferase
VSGGLLERWLEEVLATPGLTAIRDAREARRVLVDDALRALPLIRMTPGSVVDVGSGGGSPGLPIGMALPHRSVTLLESTRWKCDFLQRFAGELPGAEVVCGRAEEQGAEVFDIALAKALAKPPVAAELCLPLIRPGGLAILWVGSKAGDSRVAFAAECLGGMVARREGGLLVLRKLTHTPPGFPRRPGMAKKRPLG